mmetsp:Transcript_14659/g.22125  ORF Transcript_14659/g.22125 Transcript_14659/m.22125 type:complete len:422 (+) Transcript_14659:45-1310(+)
MNSIRSISSTLKWSLPVQYSRRLSLHGRGTDTAYVSCDSNPATGAISPPIDLSTTFERDINGEFSRGFNYSRLGNPTRCMFEKIFTELEFGKESLAFSSGMQAATALMLAMPKCHVLLPDDLYHGVYLVAKDLLSQWGMTMEKLDMTNHNLVKKRLEYTAELDNTRPVLLWLETPSNPQCKVSDIASLVSMARNALCDRVVVAVDSTWASPYLLNPLCLGADVVMHSLTKYVAGHSDVLGGVLTAGDTPAASTLLPRLRLTHQLGGGVLSAWDSWMAMRGVRTLPVRMRQHCAGASAVAAAMNSHPCVELVHYPGLPSHPQHDLATKQMRGYGGMLSLLVRPACETSNGSMEALKVVRNVQLFKRATSLGGTESLIEHRRSVEGAYPVSPPNLLRISVGLEDPGDLIDDLSQSLFASATTL